MYFGKKIMLNPKKNPLKGGILGILVENIYLAKGLFVAH